MGKAGGDEVAAGDPAVSPLGLVPVGGSGKEDHADISEVCQRHEDREQGSLKVTLDLR